MATLEEIIEKTGLPEGTKLVPIAKGHNNRVFKSEDETKLLRIGYPHCEEDYQKYKTLYEALHEVVPMPKLIREGSIEADGHAYPYMVQEYVKGKNLADLMQEDDQTQKCEEVAKALHSLHKIKTDADQFISFLYAKTIQALESLAHNGHLDKAEEYAGIFKTYIEEYVSKAEYTPALVHGDIYHGNFIFDNGKLKAIVDWDYTMFADPAWEFSMDSGDSYLQKYLELARQDDFDEEDFLRRKDMYRPMRLLFIAEALQKSRPDYVQNFLDKAYESLQENLKGVAAYTKE